MARERTVVVRERGSYVGKKGERLVVRVKGRVLDEVPFFDLEGLVLEGSGISLSADAVYGCVESGAQVDLLSSTGRPYAKIVSPVLLGTVATRREQMLAYLDARGVKVAKAIVDGKVRNQANTLRYFGKSRRTSSPEQYEMLVRAAEAIRTVLLQLDGVGGDVVDDVRTRLMSIEALCARQYWAALEQLLPESLRFTAREHRGATDPVNACLNYGYGVLYARVWGAAILAGLEPFAGFLHTDRPGKPSLVLDLTEEFRPSVVDRPLLAWLLRGRLARQQDDGDASGDSAEPLGQTADGAQEQARFELDIGVRREIAGRVRQRLDDRVQYQGAKHRLCTVIQRQARRLAGCLREDGRYRPYVEPW